MNDTNITFNQETLNNISKDILNYSVPVTAEERYNAFKSVVKEAKIFIKDYSEVKKQILNYETKLKMCIKQWHTIKAIFQNQGYTNAEIRKTNEAKKYYIQRAKIKEENFSTIIQDKAINVYKKALKIQNDLNLILGQRVVVTYVWAGKAKIPQTYLIYDMSDFLYLDVNKHGEVVARYRDSVRKLRKYAQKVEKKEYSDQFKYEKLQETYSRKVVERHNKYKVNGGSYILWLNPDFGQKWHGGLVSSFGSINQAYADILLHQRFNPRDVQEDDMEQFMNVVLGVTNLKGALQGDTQVQNMEMAVKSAGASTLDIQQIYELTEQIVNKKMNNYEVIKNFLEQKKKTFKKEQQRINVDLKELLKDQVGSNVNQIINTLNQKRK